MARAFLFDGTGLLYRAYFAIDQSLTTTTGIPTGALFGLTRMLVKFIREYLRPGEDYCAFVIDVKGGSTYRKQLFERYKAHRPETPEPLLRQIDFVGEIVEAFGLRLVRQHGYEADDVIATLTRRLEEKMHDLRIEEINIVTSDKDLLQLVSEHVSVWRIERGVAELKRYTPGDVKEKYGVMPSQIKDYLSLVGDASDNIPGVPGIGEKTAQRLLQEFGSVENAINFRNRLPDRIRESLLGNLEDFELSRKLVELNCHVPIDFDLGDLLYRGFNPNTLLETLRKFEFSSIIRELQLTSEATREAVYKPITSPQELDKLLQRIERAKKVALDLETTALDPFTGEVVGVSVAVDEGEAYYIPVGHKGVKNIPLPSVVDFLSKLVGGPYKVGGHNLKFDLKFLARLGVEIDHPAFDTMIEAYLLNPNEKRFNLDELALKLLGHKMIAYEEVVSTSLPLFAGDFSYVPLESAVRYSCEDADVSLRIHNRLYPVIYANEMNELYENIELPLVSVLARMELNGVYFDVDYLSKLSVEMDKKLTNLSHRIFELAGESFNLNSPKQIGHILFEKLKLPPVKSTDTGAHSTDVEVLETLAQDYEIARLILEHRKIQKLKSTYVDAIPSMVNPVTGRVHATFNQTGTATGRLSSSDPNLQNLPGRTEEGREIRAAVRPQRSDWWILGADYSQIELRVLAHMSEDEVLISSFSENRDIHLETAKRIFRVSDEFVTDAMRRVGKMVNFAIIYGVSPYGLARRIGMDVKDTRRIIENYLSNYKGVQRYIAEVKEFARKNGFVKTLFGRRRDIPQLAAKDQNIRAEGERIAVNTPIQGTAADIMKIAMIRIHRRLRAQNLRAMMILQVHDELVFEVPNDELELVKTIVKEEMENAAKLRVPLTVDLYVEKGMI